MICSILFIIKLKKPINVCKETHLRQPKIGYYIPLDSKLR